MRTNSCEVGTGRLPFHTIQRSGRSGDWEYDATGSSMLLPVASLGLLASIAHGLQERPRSFMDALSDIEHKQTAQFEKFRSHILELLAGGDPLPAILLAIVQGIEQLHPAMLCGILLVSSDGRHLEQGVARGLPDFYNKAIDGSEIGLGLGSCGAAAFTGGRVAVDDITTHPYWESHRELAASAGLGACSAQAIRSSSGKVLGTLAIYHHGAHTHDDADIYLIEQSARLASIAIERSLAAEKIRESEAHFRLLTEDVADVVWKADRELRITYISPADQRMRGYPADEVIGHRIFEMFTQESAAAVSELLQQQPTPQEHETQGGFATFEAQHRRYDGGLLWGEVHYKPERDEHGAITGYHGITRDVTERKQMQDQVRQLAFYDPLTKLPNRRLLNDRLAQAMATSKRNACHGAVMVLDLDNFKPLNDKHGHLVGDLLLVETAKRLASCVRESDTVARFGGDEFVVMLSDLNTEMVKSTVQASGIAEKIRIKLSAPYLLKLHDDARAQATVEHRCSASIGVVMFAGNQASHNDVLKWADAAMYRAKDAGRNLVQFHEFR